MPQFLLRCLLVAFPWVACAASGPVDWFRSDVEAFARAREQHRPVLLYLEAVWCHWCHVMDHETYADPLVAEEIRTHYVALRIDQDARPDLANRYRDYGWPATVVFAADGSEIVKRQGYLPKDRFLRLLHAIDADPTPESDGRSGHADAAPAGESSVLDSSTRAELERRYATTYDRALGGLAIAQKFLDRDSVELAMARAATGSASDATQARQTLDAAQALIDPVWGGVYQYSTMGDWKHPHYEKLATIQAEYLRIYALAWSAFHRDSDRAVVTAIRRYLNTFMAAPSGAWRVSQDADAQPGVHAADYFALDDTARRTRGVPRVDAHQYAQQTGQIAEALATWAEMAGDASAAQQALRSVTWALRERALPGGGFRHDAHDGAGPYLADNLAMARAFLALYRATADRTWLRHAVNVTDFIEKHFRRGDGYASAGDGGPIAAVAQIDENLSLARHANLLARYTGNLAHRAIADHALHWLAKPSIALSRLTEAGLLLADQEARTDPLHLAVVGAKSDSVAQMLFSTSQQQQGWYKRVEWWDRDEGELPNPDVAYPKLKAPAAYVCTDRRCSLPLRTANELQEFLRPQDPHDASNGGP
ncbi:MAG: DUF255 domain-containing protein [Tahibacter sp.]